jgi:hypothetical protein
MMIVGLRGDPRLAAIEEIIPRGRTAQLHHRPKESAATSTENDIVRGTERGIKMDTGRIDVAKKRKGVVVECLSQARCLRSHTQLL